MWELGLSAIITLGQEIYSRFSKARGLSKEFAKDLDAKIKYFVEMSQAQSKCFDEINQLVDDSSDIFSLDGNTRTLKKILVILKEFTNTEGSLSHLRSMNFYEVNRVSLQKLKRKDREWLSGFYSEFSALDASAKRRCSEIDAGIDRTNAALKHWSNFFTTHEAFEELEKILEQFDDYSEDLRNFILAVQKMG